MKRKAAPKRKKTPKRKPRKIRRQTRTSARRLSRPERTTPFEVHTILVPIDFSAHSKNALHCALPIAESFGASLHLVYVVEPTMYPADLGFGQVVLPGVEDELREKGGDQLKALIRSEIGNRVDASWIVRTGNPHQEILREAEERGVDMIVVATHGHSGVEHMLFGSTADRVVRHARCPVLTVGPQ